MTHFESASAAKQKDAQALNAILGLNEEALYERVIQYDITMCGIAPAVIMLTAVKALGATQAQLVAYTHSGEITGDYENVVAYASVIIM